MPEPDKAGTSGEASHVDVSAPDSMAFDLNVLIRREQQPYPRNPYSIYALW